LRTEEAPDQSDTSVRVGVGSAERYQHTLRKGSVKENPPNLNAYLAKSRSGLESLIPKAV